MWIAGAATAPTGFGGLSNEVIISIVGLLVAIVTVLGGVAVALINAGKSSERSDKVDQIGDLRERMAKVELRAEDSDERDEIQDRRHDQVERYLDLENPQWRPDDPDGTLPRRRHHDHG